MFNRFDILQNSYFNSSCKKRHKWQTQNQVIIQAESNLLKHLCITTGIKVLELGCGTGSNLFNLKTMGESFNYTGIDINEKEISFATREFPGDKFIVGDATSVSLPDGLFDLVFCRDVIHHLEPHRQLKLFQEMTRLTRAGGKVVLIESNGLNFVIRIFGKLVRAERYVLYSTPERIAKLLGKVEALDTDGISLIFVEPWNLFRFILHYKLGLPWLSKSKIIRGMFEKLINIVSKTIPVNRSSYMIFTALKGE